MKHRHAALIVFCCAAGVTLAAQDQIAFQSAAGFNSIQGPTMDVIAMDPLSLGPLVPDAPYAAESVTEFTQVLADGNRIERRTTGKVARNSQGAVRREQGISFGPLAASSQPIVTIDDAANGVHLMPNYDTRTASRVRMMSSMIMSAPNSSEPAVIAYGTGGKVAGAAIATEPVESVHMEAVGAAGAMMTWTAAVPAPGKRFEGDAKTETLEPKEIEGLRAEGSRTTVTLPAGSVGNVLPIEVVSERWFSPDLKVVLYTRRSDPRLGETIYRLTNIDRAEPPPDLFRVPDGFKIEDGRPGLPRLMKQQ